MLNHFHRRLGRLRQLLHRGRWHCGLPRLCRWRSGVGGHVWRQVATVAVLGRYAPGGSELNEAAGIFQDCCTMVTGWVSCWKTMSETNALSLSLSYAKSRQERPSSFRSEKVTNLRRKDKSTWCHFWHRLLGGLPWTSHVPCQGLS